MDTKNREYEVAFDICIDYLVSLYEKYGIDCERTKAKRSRPADSTNESALKCEKEGNFTNNQKD